MTTLAFKLKHIGDTGKSKTQRFFIYLTHSIAFRRKVTAAVLSEQINKGETIKLNFKSNYDAVKKTIVLPSGTEKNIRELCRRFNDYEFDQMLSAKNGRLVSDLCSIFANAGVQITYGTISVATGPDKKIPEIIIKFSYAGEKVMEMKMKRGTSTDRSCIFNVDGIAVNTSGSLFLFPDSITDILKAFLAQKE